MVKRLKSWQISLAITAGFVVSLAAVRWGLSLASDWLFSIGAVSDIDTDIANQIIQFLVYTASAILPLCIGLCIAKIFGLKTGLSTINTRHLTIAFFVLFLPFSMLAGVGTAIGVFDVRSILPKFSAPNALTWTIFVIIFVYLSCVLEEAVFRGAILNSYTSTMHAPVVAIVASSVFFAVCHADWQVELLISRSILGLGLAWVTWRSGSIGMAIGFHFATNLASNVLSSPMGINRLSGHSDYSATSQGHDISLGLVVFYFVLMISTVEIIRAMGRNSRRLDVDSVAQ